MKRRENKVRVRISIIAMSIFGLLLFTSASSLAGDYDDGGTHDITVDEGYLNIGITVPGTTVNLYANISDYIIVGSGSFLNIYSGNVVNYISVAPGPPAGAVTVYGTGFGGDGDLSAPGQVTFTSGSGTLTGYYGNGSPFSLFFYSDVPIYLEPPVVSEEEVEIDIKPGSYPNSINLKSNGVVPVAVLTTMDFDASIVDPATVEFAGASPLRWAMCDVDEDGDDDMIFHFKTQELNLDENSTEAELTGKTNGGDDITGTDDVRIVPPKTSSSQKSKKK